MPFQSRNRSTERWRRRLLLGSLAALPLAWAGCDFAGRQRQSGIGSPLPARDFPRLDGGRKYLSAAAGPCLINFWATWCPPCRAEMASLDRLHKAFSHFGLGVFAVSVDEDVHLVREFTMKTPLSFPVLLDPGATHARQDYRIAVFPTTLLVERGGRIRDVWVGERDWDAPAIRAAGRELLSA